MRLPDIDAFLIQCAHRYARATTSDLASSVRSFARFLLASGRIGVELADAVIAPVQPRFRATASCLALGGRSATAACRRHEHGARDARPRAALADEYLRPRRWRGDPCANAGH
jgi:hypothetical protein